MTIFERLEEFFNYKDLSFNKVSSMTGISPGLLSKGLKKPDASLGSEKIIMILEYFPELSAEWLLRGKGRMILDTRISPNSNQGLFDENCLLCQEKNQTIKAMKDQVDYLKDEIIWLRNKLG